jgi:hypothetical protein
MLTARQRRLYRNKVDLYRPVYTIDPTTKNLTNLTYVLDAANTGIRALLETHPRVESKSDQGRIEGDNLFTRETWHFPASQAIDSEWVIVERTIDRRGHQSPNYGRRWITSGQAQTEPSLGGRNNNNRRVMATQLADAPPGVP